MHLTDLQLQSFWDLRSKNQPADTDRIFAFGYFTLELNASPKANPLHALPSNPNLRNLEVLPPILTIINKEHLQWYTNAFPAARVNIIYAG